MQKPPTQGIHPDGFVATRFGEDSPLDTNTEVALGDIAAQLACAAAKEEKPPTVRFATAGDE